MIMFNYYLNGAIVLRNDQTWGYDLDNCGDTLKAR